MEPLFSPALHRQRHQFVIDFVQRNKPKKVVDLGCGECNLLKKLKFHREIELLVGVDVNGTKVKKHIHGLAPLSTDYLQPSYDELHIELYQGSVTQKDARLRGFDLVTSIELIEHLTPPDVERFSEVVFGYMTPEVVIISTPNSEFNPLLPGLAGFRHSDHKFEWTRAEFKSWALKVCLEFGYEVEFTGVGRAPSGQQDQVGFCSQIAVFQQRGERRGDDEEDVFSYTLLYSVKYPSLRDNNILKRVLVNEVLFWAEKLKCRWMEENYTPSNPEGGGEESPSERCTAMEGSLGACGAEMRSLVERCGEVVSEEQEVFLTNHQRGEDCCTSHRSLSVPLDVLWSCSPKISGLSGNLNNLQRLLINDPIVRLSHDGAAVLVNYQEQGLEEKEDDELDDSRFTDAGRCRNTTEEEDWET